MTSIINRRIVLASRPHGEPSADNFRIEEVPVAPTGHDQILVRNRFLSLDPYMRGRMDEGPSYAAPVAIDAVMEGGTVGEVIASNHADYHPGDLLVLPGGWQAHSLLTPTTPLRKLPKDDSLPPSTALGVYGMPGFTAYAGLHEIGKPQPGETLVVAAASGPVGATVRWRSWHVCRACAWSPLPVARKKYVICVTRCMWMWRWTTAPTTLQSSCAPQPRTASTSISKTWVARCSMRCCRSSTSSHASRSAA
ncbi:hypothetical protein XACJJ10_130110 [Xanthomonas citri pv. citri]|nr:hypothetical protein XACJJ10_130110 [Xanthomonas citri pv. citri]